MLDVCNLFTCIPLDETIDIALDYAFQDTNKVKGLSKNQFKKLIQMATKETHFMFNNNVYDQIDGVAMGSPLAPVLANIFMRKFEENVFALYDGAKPFLYRRYVDDIFLLFKKHEDIHPFFNFLNQQHPNIQFTMETESPDCGFPFLDVHITRHENSFLTRTYYKQTHTGLYTNWYSFTPRKYKLNLVKCLLFRAWQICSNRILFEDDWIVIKHNLVKNLYPEQLLDAVYRNFVTDITKKEANLRKEEEKDETLMTVPKKEVLLILPFLGASSSKKLHKSLITLFSKAYRQVNLKIVFRTTFRISSLFRLKDNIPKRLKSLVVYRVHCTECDATYIGKTKRHMATRLKEHLDPRKPTAVTEHLIHNNHNTTMDNIEFLTTAKNDGELLIKESFFVKRLKPSLNENVSSFPLQLF